MNINITLNSKPYDLVETKYPKRTSVDNPDKPGKKKMQIVEHTIIGPAVNTVDEWVEFFGAVLHQAEANTAGNGLKMVHKLLFPLLETAGEIGFNPETEIIDLDAYVAALTTPESSRSSVSKEALNEQLATLAPELSSLASAAVSADGWKNLRDADGAQLFTSYDDYIMRLAAIQSQVTRVMALMDAASRRSEQIQKRRTEKAAKAAEAAKRAAEATAAAAA